MILAAPITNGLFGLAISAQLPITVPGAPFFLGGVLCVVSLWLAGRRYADYRSAGYTPSAAQVATV